MASVISVVSLHRTAFTIAYPFVTYRASQTSESHALNSEIFGLWIWSWYFLEMESFSSLILYNSKDRGFNILRKNWRYFSLKTSLCGTWTRNHGLWILMILLLMMLLNDYKTSRFLARLSRPYTLWDVLFSLGYVFREPGSFVAHFKIRRPRCILTRPGAQCPGVALIPNSRSAIVQQEK